MTARVTLRHESEEDLREAFEWYESQREGLGGEFLRAVRSCLDSIKRGPELYRTIALDIRRAVLRVIPYGVFYFIEDERVIVIAVLHHRRDPRVWLNRVGRAD